MDTNLDGVSVADVADLLDDETEQLDQGQLTAGDEEVQPDEPESQTEGDGQDDAEEVEFEGKAYKVPKELKYALLRTADYTQKTQAVADQRKAVEERAQLLDQRERVMGMAFDKAVELREVQNRLAQFDQIDWRSLAQNDPAQATQLNIAYQQLQREAQKKYGELQQVQAASQQLTETQRQQMLADAEKDLKARLPSFNAEVAAQIKVAAREYGITDQELNAVMDPRYVHVLHDAMKWRALQAEKPKAMQKVVQAPKAIKPQAAQPKQRTNQAALDRLKKNGRVEDLAAFL